MVHDPRVSQTLARLGGLYRDPSRVDRDASSLLKSSVGSTLSPIAAQLVEDNGNSSNVLVLQGTIAIHFRGNTYQLLVDIYLPAGYPHRPPVCFVRLAENMYLKENHRHVGSDGKVYLPYLHEWRNSTHNLVELVVAMSSVFSAEPPVFSRPAASTSTAAPSTSFTTASSSSQQQSTSFASSSSSSYLQQKQAEAILAAEAAEANAAAEAARRAAAEEQAKKAEKERAIQAQREWEKKRTDQVRDTVRQNVMQYLQDESNKCLQQVQNDHRDKQRLTLAEEQKITLQLEYYRKQAQELERQCAVVDECKEDIEDWLKTARQSIKDGAEVQDTSVDDLVQPASSLHAQMLGLAAENSALSDALYFLDRALYKGHLTLETHLRQVRKLAKRQFLVRAHLIKINQVLLNRPSGS